MKCEGLVHIFNAFEIQILRECIKSLMRLFSNNRNQRYCNLIKILSM